MTHAALRQEKESGFELSELWRLPFALMLKLFCAFFRLKLDWLKQQRRTRPLPRNWRQHYDQLRLAEWSVIEITAAGLAQLLSGKTLNLEGIIPVDPPADWHCPMPRSAFEMHRRIEAAVAFNADPEGRIRRSAERIRREPISTPSLEIEAPLLSFFPAAVCLVVCLSAQRIRAPPSVRSTVYCPLPIASRAAPARSRPHARRQEIDDIHSQPPNSFLKCSYAPATSFRSWVPEKPGAGRAPAGTGA